MGDYLQYGYEINLEIPSVESSFQYFVEVSLPRDCLIHPTQKDSCTDMVANEIDPQNNYSEDAAVVDQYCFQATKWESFHAIYYERYQEIPIHAGKRETQECCQRTC